MVIRTKYQSWTFVVLGSFLLSAGPARADLIAAVQSVTASVGSMGNPLEVTLENTGAPMTIASFSFKISTSDMDITFTGTNANTVTAPYIFAPGDSFDIINGFPLNTIPLPGQMMDGTDLSNSGAGTVIGTNVTFALGRVLFDVSPTATLGSFAVTLLGSPDTSLAGPDFGSIPINTLTNGSITVVPSTPVPEPRAIILFASALLALILAKRSARRGVC